MQNSEEDFNYEGDSKVNVKFENVKCDVMNVLQFYDEIGTTCPKNFTNPKTKIT